MAVSADPRADDVAELLRRTRTDRGLTRTINEPAVIDKVAAIVAAGRNHEQRQEAA